MPSDIVTCESANPVHFGPTRPSPFEPWQLAQPEADASSWPACASADNSIEAELLPEEHEAKKRPTEASNTEVVRKLINLNFEVMFKEYRSMQVEFATVDTQIW